MTNKETVVYEMFERHKGMIKEIIRKGRYTDLDPAIDNEDIEQEAYIGVHEAFKNARKETNAKPSTIIHFYVKRQITNLFKNIAIVIIKYPDGLCQIVSYQEFLKIKNSLPAGAEYYTQRRFVSCQENGTGDQLLENTKKNGRNTE